MNNGWYYYLGAIPSRKPLDGDATVRLEECVCKF